jgi:hypothetical protein
MMMIIIIEKGIWKETTVIWRYYLGIRLERMRETTTIKTFWSLGKIWVLHEYKSKTKAVATNWLDNGPLEDTALLTQQI